MHEKRKPNTMWLLAVMYFVQTFFLSYTKFFALSLLWLIAIIVLDNFRICKLNIPGLKIYILALVCISIVGVCKYPIYLVARDVYYEISNIVIIYIGYRYFYKNNKLEDLLKLYFVMISMLAIVTVAIGIINILKGAGFNVFRESFSTGIKTIGVFLPIFFIYCLIYKNVIISPVVDRCCLMIWFLQALFNLSRTTLVDIAVGILLFLVFNLKKGYFNMKYINRAMLIILCAVCVMFLAFKIVPESVRNRFLDKFTNTFTEIDSNTEFNSIADASSNWRGYEIHCAQEQFRESTFVEKVIGSGNGTIIHISYVPDLWHEILDTQDGRTGVTVLHNSYYTLLIKGGVCIVTLFCLFFIKNILRGIKLTKNEQDSQISFVGIVLVIMCVIMMMDAWVVRGMVQSDTLLPWSFFFGWLSAKISKEYEVEKTLGNAYR